MDISFIAKNESELQELKESLQLTTLLNLSRNLLKSWSDITQIVSIIPALNCLILSGNQLNVTERAENFENNFETLEIFAKIQTLVIDNIKCDWIYVTDLICHLVPNLERLDLWENQITKLTTPSLQSFQSLQYLDLSKNPIESWQEILKLGNLPKLKSLNISNCKLNSIRFDVETGKTKSFPSLTDLILNENQLESWRDVAELNKLSNLSSLMLKRNPICEQEKYDVFFILTISRLEKLTTFNREKVFNLVTFTTIEIKLVFG